MKIANESGNWKIVQTNEPFILHFPPQQVIMIYSCHTHTHIQKLHIFPFHVNTREWMNEEMMKKPSASRQIFLSPFFFSRSFFDLRFFLINRRLDIVLYTTLRFVSNDTHEVRKGERRFAIDILLLNLFIHMTTISRMRQKCVSRSANTIETMITAFNQ